MKEKIKTCLAVCILVITVPYVVTLVFQGGETSTGTGTIQEALKEPAKENSGPQKTSDEEENSDPQKTSDEKESPGLKKTDAKQDVEGYLTGILAKQIPLDYQREAVKAQAVIARTALTLALETDGQKLPESMSREEMLELWGQEGFEQNYQQLEEAAQATKGEILLYNGTPIQPAFHAVSSGKTRNAKEAFLREDEPYLAGTDSGMDIPSPDFLKVVFLEQEEFADKIKELCPEIPKDNVMDAVTVTQRDGADYAVQVTIGEKTVTGEEFRNCLNLNSSCFYLKEVENKIRIVTKGLGHGLGLSQYGANELAKEGKTYQEILQYYYKDVSIEKK